MSEKLIFISSSDSKYYPLLREWVHCIRSFPEGANADIGIMDVGLTDEQIEALRPHVTTIVKPEWPCPLPAHKTRGKDYLKACVARPFIREYFPGYELYFWMDPDTWIQDWHAIELFKEGARRRKIALTGQVDRAYPRQVRVKWLGRWPIKVRTFYYSNALRAFGFKTARKILPYHVLLAGAFCLHKDAPHWDRWQELVVQAATRGKVFTAEQLTLGIMCYMDGYPYEILPGWSHWLCEFKPLWDQQRQKFVEPYLPHTDIGILHLSGVDEMRLDRSVVYDFQTLTGETVKLSYRYPAFDGALERPLQAQPDLSAPVSASAQEKELAED